MKKALLIPALALFLAEARSQVRPVVTAAPEIVAQLPDAVKETSALLYWNGYFWTHNDSGNPPFLFRLDTATGAVKKAIWIRGSYNYDWECMAQDEHYLYLGDTGDNQMKRPRKRIYRISKEDLMDTAVREVTADTIGFRFPSINGVNTCYDVEAMVYANGLLHFFTKDGDTTRHFTVPVSEQERLHTAIFVDMLPIKGRVTDACYDAGQQLLYLLISHLYSNKYIWSVKTSGPDLRLGDVKDKIHLGTLPRLGQLEAMCMLPDGVFYFTNEKFQAVPQRLWRWWK